MDFNRRAFRDKGRQLKKINGFFSPQSHAFWDLLLRWQKDHMAPGHLVEIGVWKGKSSSVLASLKRDEEQLHMIDPGLKEERFREPS